MATYDEMKDAMRDLDDEVILSAAHDVVDTGNTSADECMKACQDGLQEVGNLFEEGEYFVGDLVFAGELMGQVMDILAPVLAGDRQEAIGKMIICTVKDDLHDIGKNIVAAMLKAGGLDVMDLGIDVSPETIVTTAEENDIHIIALSGVLTLAIDSMKATVDAFKNAGIRDTVHIIIGGNPVTEEGCKFVGADAWAILPQETVRICSEWAREA